MFYRSRLKPRSLAPLQGPDRLGLASEAALPGSDRVSLASSPSSFPHSLDHLLRQLRADATLFVFEVDKRFLPLILLALDKFCPTVDIGRLVILAPQPE